MKKKMKRIIRHLHLTRKNLKTTCPRGRLFKALYRIIHLWNEGLLPEFAFETNEPGKIAMLAVQLPANAEGSLRVVYGTPDTPELTSVDVGPDVLKASPLEFQRMRRVLEIEALRLLRPGD